MADKKNNNVAGIKKIDALLEQMGISEEARKEFCTVCEGWYESEKDKLQVEFKARLDKAKKVCVEEVEAHKASLSRGVQLFLESQTDSIRKANEKSAAIAESESVKTLKQVQKLLGGLDIGGVENTQALQAESKKNAVLTQELATVKESRDKFKVKAAKLSEIADKSVARQKDLEKQIAKQKMLLGEAREHLVKKDKQETANNLSERKVKGAKPKTKSKSISESDKTSDKPAITEGTAIDAIVASMD